MDFEGWHVRLVFESLAVWQLRQPTEWSPLGSDAERHRCDQAANRLTIATRLCTASTCQAAVERGEYTRSGRWQRTAIWMAGLASGSDASDEAKSMLERTILNC
jgi:hypothetical protein